MRDFVTVETVDRKLMSALGPRAGASSTYVLSRLEDGVTETKLVNEAELLALFHPSEPLTGDSDAALKWTVSATKTEPDASITTVGDPTHFVLLVHSVDVQGDAATAAALRAENLIGTLSTSLKASGTAKPNVRPEPDTKESRQKKAARMELIALFEKAEKVVQSIHAVPENYGGIIDNFLRTQGERSDRTRRDLEGRLGKVGVPLPDLPIGIEHVKGPLSSSHLVAPHAYAQHRLAV